MSSEIRKQKEQIVEDIKDRINRCAGFVVIDYKGLTVEADTALRREFRDNGIEYKVIKNTMMRIALEELGYKEFDEALNGPTAVAFGYEDALIPIKIASDNIKKLNKMEIKCGMVEKAYCDAATMKALANVPGRQVLLSMLCNVLQAPIRGLAVVCDQYAKKLSKNA